MGQFGKKNSSIHSRVRTFAQQFTFCMKKLKTEKKDYNLFCPLIQDSKTVYEYESRPEYRPVKLQTLFFSVKILKIFERPLIICKNMFTSQI